MSPQTYTNPFAVLECMPSREECGSPFPLRARERSSKRKNKGRKKCSPVAAAHDFSDPVPLKPESSTTIESLPSEAFAEPDQHSHSPPRSPVRIRTLHTLQTQSLDSLSGENLVVHKAYVGWRPRGHILRPRSKSLPALLGDIPQHSEGEEPLMYSLSVGEKVDNIGKPQQAAGPESPTRARLQMPRTARSPPRYQEPAQVEVPAEMPTLTYQEEQETPAMTAFIGGNEFLLNFPSSPHPVMWGNELYFPDSAQGPALYAYGWSLCDQRYDFPNAPFYPAYSDDMEFSQYCWAPYQPPQMWGYRDAANGPPVWSGKPSFNRNVHGRF